MEFKHIPIMLNEVIENLNIKPDGVYVDCTIGGAGHSFEIAKRLSSKGTLIGIDKDLTALEVSKNKLSIFNCKKIFVHDDYKNILKILEQNNLSKVDGILADFGVSSYQIDEATRGFSYMKDAKLDMRMDQTKSLTAFDVVNKYSEKELIKILFDYGEENFAKNIVKNIILSRNQKPIETTQELVKIIEKSVPSKILHKGGSVAKKTFQALRIEVNGELDGLENSINDMIEVLNSKGRLCIITFHSLEDRIVKNCFNFNATDCICPKTLPICVCNHKSTITLITKKPLIPGQLEMQNNTRSQSSKLRIAEKK